MSTPTLTDESHLVSFYGSQTRLDQFTNEDADVLANAIAIASSTMANALYQRHDVAAVDALTPDTCPAEPQRHVNAFVAEILTSGGRGRAEDIQVDADNARAYCSDVRTGKVIVDSLTALSSAVADGSGSGNVRYRAPSERVFDRDNTSQTFSTKFKLI